MCVHTYVARMHLHAEVLCHNAPKHTTHNNMLCTYAQHNLQQRTHYRADIRNYNCFMSFERLREDRLFWRLKCTESLYCTRREGTHTVHCTRREGTHTVHCTRREGTHTVHCTRREGAHTVHCTWREGAHTVHCTRREGTHTVEYLNKGHFRAVSLSFVKRLSSSLPQKRKTAEMIISYSQQND
jgi:hypothetical protein